ncbi:hypothetical protein A4A58_15465 [Tardiphaga robiniae]|uniref:Uncharacterized protein n=1 Tax=Tardiphaga robiniae TaxID=943830 RepID=A0A161QM76_9BRAD|nr:hypothetical protein A4A58_15465 [Tardiphaga robiniae]
MAFWLYSVASKSPCLRARSAAFTPHARAIRSHIAWHTITDTRRLLVTRNRIALDTGAYGTGHLTTLIIDPVSDSLDFAWTVQSDSEVTVEFTGPDVTSVPEGHQNYFNTISKTQSAR